MGPILTNEETLYILTEILIEMMGSELLEAQAVLSKYTKQNG